MTKNLKDIDISRLLNIPQSNLREWKKKENDNWRFKIYTILKNMSEEEIRLVLNRNKSLKPLN